MCQIIAIENRDKYKFKDSEIATLLSRLTEKGGDYYKAIIYNNIIYPKTIEAFSYEDFCRDFMNYYISNSHKFKYLFLFSRQQPEMENEKYLDSQPYFSQDNDKIYFIHGTIGNDEELKSKYNLKFDIDTEIFKFIDFKKINISELQGAYAGISFNGEKIDILNNGLKIWKESLFIHNKKIDIYSTTKIIEDNELLPNQRYIPLFDDKNNINEKNLVVLMSGGMDIISSFMYTFQREKNVIKKITFLYFDYDTKASEQEIKTILKFYELINNKEIDIFNLNMTENYQKNIDVLKNIEIKIIPFSINGKKLINGKGDIKETELPLAYVPYRNSKFLLEAASIAEEELEGETHFLLGLNLSEGMVYLDNSEAWLESMSELIKYGGKDFNVTKNFKILAPFYAKTKSNMLKEIEFFFEEKIYTILENTFSCYYPVNGNACGKCGSCILRNKSIEKLK